MKYTEFLNLKKPDLTDTADIGDINDNMDLLDALLASWFIEEGETWNEDV